MSGPEQVDEELIHRLMDEAAGRIGEHADSVLIIVTFPRPATDTTGPSTGIIKTGAGNYYAQRASAMEWIAGSHNVFLPNPSPPPPPDEPGEEWKSGK